MTLKQESLMVPHMQAALREHDMILTVSPGYALEICSDAAMACGMQDILQRRGVRCE